MWPKRTVCKHILCRTNLTLMNVLMCYCCNVSVCMFLPGISLTVVLSCYNVFKQLTSSNPEVKGKLLHIKSYWETVFRDLFLRFLNNATCYFKIVHSLRVLYAILKPDSPIKEVTVTIETGNYHNFHSGEFLQDSGRQLDCKVE